MSITLPNQNPTSQGTVVEQTRAAAEVAAAVGVARNFPRTPDVAVAAMRELCSRISVAERAFYEVPNRGAGPSIHLARELARIWGNLDYGVRELARNDTDGTSEMSVWAWDQETNVRSTRSFIQPHQRMKAGRRQDLTDLGDVYLNNQNTGARAVRECIFTVLPGWFVAEAETICKTTLRNGEGKPIGERRSTAIEKFATINVTEAQLIEGVGKPVQKWDAGDLAALTRAYSSITIDGISAKEFFPEQAVTIPAIDPTSPEYIDPESVKS